MKRAVYLALLAAGLLIATDAQAHHVRRGRHVTTSRRGNDVTTTVTDDGVQAIPENGKTMMLLGGALVALAAVRLRLAN